MTYRYSIALAEERRSSLSARAAAAARVRELPAATTAGVVQASARRFRRLRFKGRIGALTSPEVQP